MWTLSNRQCQYCGKTLDYQRLYFCINHGRLIQFVIDTVGEDAAWAYMHRSAKVNTDWFVEQMRKLAKKYAKRYTK